MNLNEWTPELRRKLYEYRKQDHENGIHDKRTAISAAETVELVAKAKGKCAHCKQPVSFEKNPKMRGNGFTLDRKNDKIGHTRANCAVSCLECNVKNKEYRDPF
jgi:hypothetical protein